MEVIIAILLPLQVFSHPSSRKKGQKKYQVQGSKGAQLAREKRYQGNEIFLAMPRELAACLASKGMKRGWRGGVKFPCNL